MITLTFTVKTEENGTLAVDSKGIGVGSKAETELAMLIYELGKTAFEIHTIRNGGTPVEEITGSITKIPAPENPSSN